MDFDNEEVDLTTYNPFESSQSMKFMKVYKTLSSESIDSRPKDLLITILSACNTSYNFATNKAGEIAGDSGKNRMTYNPDKAGLMKYAMEDDVNHDKEERVLDLVKNAINGFLSDKQSLEGLTKDQKKLNLLLVRCLTLQIISSGIYYLIDGLLIPEYVSEGLKNSIEYMNNSSKNVFDNFLNDLKETGNEFLVDYISSLGIEIFGLGVLTHPNRHFDSQIKPYMARVKNYDKLYKLFLLRRSEYYSAAINVNKKNLYGFFGLTGSTYDKGKSKLMDEFSLRYEDDVNNYYLQKMVSD